MKSKKIICGKYDNTITLNIISKSKLIRIGSNNPNKLKKITYTPISINNKTVFYKNKYFELLDFFIYCKKKKIKDLIVLTLKEKSLALEQILDFGVNLCVLEKEFPIFKNIKYHSNLIYNYKKLVKLIKKVNTLLIKGKSLGTFYSTKHLYKIERKLRYKSTYDNLFFKAYKGGYQEVFKMKEERADRSIVAFDFNSMYASCMLDKFLDPRSLKYKEFSDGTLIENLHDGLYHVVLQFPIKEFIKNYHPFKFNRLFNSYYFYFDENNEIEILLFKNELEYYGKFFKKIKVLKGLISTKTIEHPLKKSIINIYMQRMHNRKINNSTEESMNKFELSIIHSATNQIKYKHKHLKTFFELKKELLDKYDINLNNKNTNELKLIKKHKHFQIENIDKHNYLCKFIDEQSSFNIYSLSSAILANSRLKMIQTIEKFVSFKTVEICYCNIDSIHISIEKNHLDEFLEEFKSIINDEIVSLKIESIAEKGYWFDIGRYWLFENNEVIQHKNTLFKNFNSTNVFSKWKEIKIPIKSKHFSYVKNTYPLIYNSFSYSKKLSEDFKFLRYNYEEIKTLDVAFDTINNEILASKSVKSKLFDKIATV